MTGLALFGLGIDDDTLLSIIIITNGPNPDTLRKCACSLDFIAAAIPYADYERIETLMRLQQLEGVGRNAAYKSAPWAKEAVAHFKEVQAESTLRCF